MKQCLKCKQLKPQEEFYRGRNWCKVCYKQYRHRFYQLNKERLLLEHKQYYQQHKNRYGKRTKLWRKRVQQAWFDYLPKNPECELCSKSLNYFSKDKRDSVHFDHKKENLPIRIFPKNWLNGHPPNQRNIRIWKSCGFGVLCQKCNMLPLKNREEWLNRLIHYIRK